jgi:hypothetical protein
MRNPYLTRELCVLLFFAFSFYSCSQEKLDTNNNAYVFRFLPSGKINIYGLAFGIIGSETICNIPGTKKSHGINIQIIGQGLFIPLNPKAFKYKAIFGSDSSWMVSRLDSANYKAIHNGLLISTFGTMTEKTNGISISSWSSLGYFMNGIGINLISSKYAVVNGLSISINNEAYLVKGVQIGVLNRTTKLKGFQFGLWNVNKKRKLPLINWCFKE